MLKGKRKDWENQNVCEVWQLFPPRYSISIVLVSAIKREKISSSADMVILKCLILYGCRSRNNPKYSFPYSFEMSLCFFLLLLIFTIIYRSRFQKCIFETYGWGWVCILRGHIEYWSTKAESIMPQDCHQPLWFYVQLV